jgi:phosphoribosyl 1,2-cyclic phosphodiesterase
MNAPEQLTMHLVNGAPPVGIASLGSGSRGNGTLVALAGSLFLVDCGFTLKDTIARLARLGLAAGDLTAVLVTHEHSDHVQGVGRLARRFGLPVYASRGTLDGGRDWHDVDVRPIESDRAFAIAGVTVRPVPVPHDAREPTQFVFEADGYRIGVLTDLGEVPPHVAAHYAGCDALLVEANHDPAMLWNGRYPFPLKQRIASRLGHLANEQTCEFLEHAGLARSAAVVVGHLSQENNAPARLREHLAPLVRRLPRLVLATQETGADWHPLV